MTHSRHASCSMLCAHCLSPCEAATFYSSQSPLYWVGTRYAKLLRLGRWAPLHALHSHLPYHKTQAVPSRCVGSPHLCCTRISCPCRASSGLHLLWVRLSCAPSQNHHIPAWRHLPSDSWVFVSFWSRGHGWSSLCSLEQVSILSAEGIFSYRLLNSGLAFSWLPQWWPMASSKAKTDTVLNL